MSSALKQQIQSFFEQAKYFGLTQAEVDGRIAAWEGVSSAVEVDQLLREVDPKREVFLYPVSQEQDLRLRLTRLFDDAKMTRMAEIDVASAIYDLMSAGRDVDVVMSMLPQIDPDREVFEYPIGPDEKGVHGLELWENRYENFSDTYGNHIRTSEHIPQAFADACERLWEKGVLYHHGGLSVDRKSLKGGYTVVVGLDERPLPVEADLAALKAKHGLDFECISMVLKHKPKSFGASVVMAALITDIDQLDKVPAIAQDMEEIAEKWLNDFEMKKAADQCAADLPF